MNLEFYKDGKEIILWYEPILYDSSNQEYKLKNFSTKYHAIEYALFSHKLIYQIHKTPLWGERWWR
jgi:hypothetical protein